MPIISITNQKGGVGKTTMLASLARLLTQDGYRVLCINMDPQRNLDMMAGQGFAIPPNDLETPSLLHVMQGECDIEDAIVESPLGDLVRASNLLSGWSGPELLTRSEFESFQDRPVELRDLLAARFHEMENTPPFHVLRKKLANISNSYDYIFMDTNPSLMLLTMNALYAADYVLVPVFPDNFSRTAVNELWDTIQNITYYEPTHRLQVAGLVMTKTAKRTFVTREFTNSFQKFADATGTILFESRIRQATLAGEATGARQPVVDYAGPKADITKDYIALKNEFVQRIDNLEKERC